ncbi:hypothetical protein [Yoonia sediminilitoris]|nr:hypothetical protein [Yoonia sediminilitoris]
MEKKFIFALLALVALVAISGSQDANAMRYTSDRAIQGDNLR